MLAPLLICKHALGLCRHIDGIFPNVFISTAIDDELESRLQAQIFQHAGTTFLELAQADGLIEIRIVRPRASIDIPAGDVLRGKDAESIKRSHVERPQLDPD